MTDVPAASGFHASEEFIAFDKSPSPPPASATPIPSRFNGAAAPRSQAGSWTPTGSIPAGPSSLKRKLPSRPPSPPARAKKRGRVSDPGPSNLKEERKAAERGCPWVWDVNWEECHDAAEMLNEEIQAWYRHVSPSRQEYEVRLFTIELIMRAVHKLWPDAAVTPFGSWQTQLYLPTGDIDLVVSTSRLTDKNKNELLARLAGAMRAARITTSVAVISKARVPIIKFVTNDGKLNVDISLNQTNGISAGRIINQYLDILPGARQLVLVVKAFLSQRSMNEVYTGGLGSYAVICMVISFLQVHPHLRHGNWDAEANLGTLLMEFFELYGRNFNYDDVGLSIRRGGYYFSKRARRWTRPGQSFLLSIEDPQDPDNDISGGSYGIRTVRAIFSGAFDLLQNKLFERTGELVGRNSGRIRGDWDPEDMSLLTAIMGITKETTKHRAQINDLHKSGRLHASLGIPKSEDDIDQIHTYLPHYAMTRDPPSDTANTGDPGPSTSSNRFDQPVGAIVVDDAEVDRFDSDTDSEVGEHSFTWQSRSDRPSLIFGGKRDSPPRDRFASVSMDEEEEFFNTSTKQNGTGSSSTKERSKRSKAAKALRKEAVEETRADAGQESVEEDSRYGTTSALNNRKSRRQARAAELKSAQNGGSDSESASGSDGIVALETPPTKSARSQARVNANDRLAFWASKGQKQVFEVLDSDDE